MKRWIVVAALCALAVASLMACGDDEGNPQEKGRISAIGTLSEHAVDAWVANGPIAIYNVLHARIFEECSSENFLAATEDDPRPTAWRNTKDITLQDLSHGTATVIIVVDGQDVEQPWTFELENNVRWRVVDAPGVAECIAA
jgi:hypothetical protein